MDEDYDDDSKFHELLSDLRRLSGTLCSKRLSFGGDVKLAQGSGLARRKTKEETDS